MISSALDNLISVFSPSWGARRVQWRNYTRQLKASTSEHQSMRQMLGGGSGGG